MTPAKLSPLEERAGWYGRAPWLILVAGLLLALIVTALLFLVLMQPPTADLRALISTLALTSLFSLGLGALLYRRGWARSMSLMRTLTLTYIWAALLTFFNVGILQRQMFVSEHDLILGSVLLLFAAIIATTFGVFVSAGVTDDLRHLLMAAQSLAEGDLTARVAVNGRDEVAQVGLAFNEMAGQLQQVDRQRNELDTLRRDLIAWASHDLRTPLTGIRVRVEALNDGLVADAATQQRYYQAILADVLSLNTLLDDMLELAQLDAAGLKLETTRSSLSEVIDESLQRLDPLAQGRGTEMVADIGAGVDPLPLNAAKMSRVLDNLLANALRYAPREGRVRVTAVRDGDVVTVTVEDNGPGFSADDLPRLFEQFYRGEQARSRATGGAGLGLAIARGIVEAHGGRIWAENLPEGGARVAFELPG
jgi:signal transduction histidine kinase